MHLKAYLRSALAILQSYDGNVPLAAWLKAYFKQHKKFGARDRRTIADLCFCFFRLGNALVHESIEEQLLAGQFFCHNASPFVKELKPGWATVPSTSIHGKLASLPQANAGVFFPFPDAVSGQIDKEAFALSQLLQPDLFLRTRPGKKEAVLQKLEAASVAFSVEGSCVRLPNATKLDEVIALDKEAVIQDKSSQQVLAVLKEFWKKEAFTAWDSCAASGGKSILLHDAYPKALLTVSDIRESILYNLKNRFGRAGITGYESFVADVASKDLNINKKFDLIICDAPCSGSGTWGRTPEQLRFFRREKIERYAALQKAIALNGSRCLKAGGAFLYITCSVFKEENEDVAEYLSRQTNLKPVKQRYLEGYNDKADTLFVALFSL